MSQHSPFDPTTAPAFEFLPISAEEHARIDERAKAKAAREALTASLPRRSRKRSAYPTTRKGMSVSAYFDSRGM